MVNSINTTNITNQTAETINKKDMRNLLKYMNNEVLKQKPDTFVKATGDNIKSAGIFEGIPVFNLLRRNKKLNGSFINNKMKALGENNKKALINIFKGEGKISQRIGNFIKTANESKESFSAIKSLVKSESTTEKAAVDSAKKAAKAAAKPNSAAAKKAAEKAAGKAEKAALKSAEKAAQQGAEKAASTSLKSVGKLGKFGKFIKSSGAGIMLVFSGIIEGVTEVVPTFKELGAKKGMKQLGKSAVKVAGDTAGFIAGEQLGTAVGTAIGTAICPGIGTAIGAVAGLACGMLGSWAAGKITKSITGPSERELAKEEQEQNSINEIYNDETKTEELIDAVKQKIEEETALNNGELSEDGKIALESLENLTQSNPFAA